jgi:hypothetical protein
MNITRYGRQNVSADKPKQEQVQMAETATAAVDVNFTSTDPFAEGGSNWPLCRITDKGLIVSVASICITSIILLLIFTYCLLPIVMNG